MQTSDGTYRLTMNRFDNRHNQLESLCGAEPFDIPGVKFSHHNGNCSFHALLAHHNQTDPVLQRIARIIDEADTIQEVNVEPTATGLDYICEGLRLISSNDLEAIQRGCLVYDALYARLAVEK